MPVATTPDSRLCLKRNWTFYHLIAERMRALKWPIWEFYVIP
jgi:hypothetical protein